MGRDACSKWLRAASDLWQSELLTIVALAADLLRPLATRSPDPACCRCIAAAWSYWRLNVLHESHLLSRVAQSPLLNNSPNEFHMIAPSFFALRSHIERYAPFSTAAFEAFSGTTATGLVAAGSSLFGLFSFSSAMYFSRSDCFTTISMSISASVD